MSAHGQYFEHLAAQVSLKAWQTKPRFHVFTLLNLLSLCFAIQWQV